MLEHELGRVEEVVMTVEGMVAVGSSGRLDGLNF